MYLSANAAVGKTLVSSQMIDRVGARLGRKVFEVPVGFKWFVEGLLDGSLGFVGEESAGASFLRRDGSVWTTDKDGITAALLAAEMTARNGRDPGESYRKLGEEFGAPSFERVDAVATPQQKKTAGRAFCQNKCIRPSWRAKPSKIFSRVRRAMAQRLRQPEGCHQEWLVRRAPIRYRRYLQDLRREFPRHRSSQVDHCPGPGNCHRHAATGLDNAAGIGILHIRNN